MERVKTRHIPRELPAIAHGGPSVVKVDKTNIRMGFRSLPVCNRERVYSSPHR